ncbi:MAG: uL15m family ribosomal protein [Nanoarchaeota archaeon]
MAKRKKCQRYRGHTTHGCGSMKKARGSGNRGGKGGAGTGKRSDSKKPSIWKERFGHKIRFKSTIAQPDVMNIGDLERIASTLKAEDDTVSIDLTGMGIGKLLSKGKPTRKWVIKVKSASHNAVEKIKKAGGRVDVLAE